MDLGAESGNDFVLGDRMTAARRRLGVSGVAVALAGLGLVASAAVGGYLGYSRAAFTPGGSADTDAYNVAPLDAKKAASIDATAPPPVDEAYIRKIAHDETETILHPPKKAVAVASSDDSDSSDDSSDNSNANPPTPPSPTLSQPPVLAAPKAPPPPTGLY